MDILKKFDVQVCMVSAQPLPNLMPILSCPPKTVFLLVTDRMKDKAGVLAHIIKRRTQTEVIQIPVGNGEFEDVETGLLDILEKVAGKSMITNVTGGTKLMAFAAMNFSDNSFYVTTDNQVYLFGRDFGNGQKAVLPADTKISIEDFLYVHGVDVISPMPVRNIRQQWLPFAEQVAKSPMLAAATRTLNAVIAQAAGKNKQALSAHLDYAPDRDLKQLLNIAEDCELVSVMGAELVFPSVEARDYLHGIWFEEHVFGVVKSLEGVQDCAMSVQIDLLSKEHGRRHELDVVFLADNTLFVIECKTRNYLSEKISSDERNTTIYKLDTLGDLGGLKTRKGFASLCELASSMRERAKGSKIQVWEKNDIQGLKKHLQNWIKQARNGI